MRQETPDPGERSLPSVPPGPAGGPFPGPGGEKQTRPIPPVPPFSGLLPPPRGEKGKAETRKEEFRLPRTFGKYLLLEKLGQGGMGVVFLAEDRELNRKVALKILRQETLLFHAEARERFRREARAAARLDHPGICSVYEVGEVDGFPFMAMRYVPGKTLAEEIGAAREKGGVPGKGKVMELLLVGEKVARTLHAAHEAGLVHRDIKPANIMIPPEGDPVLLDFGLARERVPSVKDLTLTMAVVGTPHYLPPERFSGKKVPPDRRGDIYSLAATLYEAFTLRCPFDAESLEELTARIKDGRHPNPRTLNPHIPKDLALVLEKAMDKNPGRRYGTALDFARDLRCVRTYEPVQVRPAGPLLKTGRWAQRNPILATSLAGIFLALLVGFLTTYFFLQEARAANRKTRAMALLAASKVALARSPRLSLLLGLESYRLAPTEQAFSQVLQALTESHEKASIDVPLIHRVGNGLVAASHDGKMLLVPSVDQALNIWSASGKKLVRIPPSQFGRVGKFRAQSLEFSPDDRKFLAAGDGGVFVWDTRGNLLLSLSCTGADSPRGVKKAWFTPESKRILVYSHPARTVQVRDLKGRRLARVQAPGNRIFSYGFSRPAGVFWILSPDRGRKTSTLFLWPPGGKPSSLSLASPGKWGSYVVARLSPLGNFFACIPDGHRVLVWDRKGRKVASIEGSVRRFHLLAFSPGDTWLCVAQGSGVLHLLPLAGKGKPLSWVAHPGGIKRVCFSPGGKMILTVSGNGDAAVWTLRGRKLFSLKGHEGPVIKGGFLGEETCFTLSDDGTLKTWDLAPGASLLLPVIPNILYSFTPLAPGDGFACVDPSGKVIRFDPSSGTSKDLHFPGKKALFLFSSRNRPLLLATGGDGRSYLWRGDRKRWSLLPGPGGMVFSADFHPARPLFLAAFTGPRKAPRETRLFSWEGDRPRLLRVFPGFSRMVRFSPGGEGFFTIGPRKSGISIYDLQGRIQGGFSRPSAILRACYLSPGDRIVAVPSGIGAYLVNRKGGILRTFHSFHSRILALAPSPGNQSFLMGAKEGALEVRDGRGDLLFRFTQAQGPVISGVFSPSERKILCAGYSWVKVLDSRTGRLLLDYTPRRRLERVGFSRTGKWAGLLSPKSGILQFLPMDPGEIFRMAREKTGAGFTPREREAYRSLLGER